jgi:hypothetical protein
MYAIVHSNACCRKPIHVPLASIKQCTFSDSSFQTKQLQENQIWTVGVKLPDFDLTYQLQVISTESQPQCHSPRSAKTEQIRIYPTHSQNRPQHPSKLLRFWTVNQKPGTAIIHKSVPRYNKTTISTVSMSMRVLPTSPRANVTSHHISSLNNAGSKAYVTDDCHGIQGSIWRQSHRAY